MTTTRPRMGVVWRKISLKLKEIQTTSLSLSFDWVHFPAFVSCSSFSSFSFCVSCPFVGHVTRQLLSKPPACSCWFPMSASMSPGAPFQQLCVFPRTPVDSPLGLPLDSPVRNVRYGPFPPGTAAVPHRAVCAPPVVDAEQLAPTHAQARQAVRQLQLESQGHKFLHQFPHRTAHRASAPVCGPGSLLRGVGKRAQTAVVFVVAQSLLFELF